ncbi:hypothetical protein BGZ83_001439, partial [Gryganskiella cystojenkinii]
MNTDHYQWIAHVNKRRVDFASLGALLPNDASFQCLLPMAAMLRKLAERPLCFNPNEFFLTPLNNDQIDYSGVSKIYYYLRIYFIDVSVLDEYARTFAADAKWAHEVFLHHAQHDGGSTVRIPYVGYTIKNNPVGRVDDDWSVAKHSRLANLTQILKIFKNTDISSLCAVYTIYQRTIDSYDAIRSQILL